MFFFKQKTAYERRISDWSSDVCSSDLDPIDAGPEILAHIDAVLRRDEDMIAAVGRNPQQVGAVLAADIPQQFCDLAGSAADRDHSRDVPIVAGAGLDRKSVV